MERKPDWPYKFRSRLPDDPPGSYSGPIYEALGCDLQSLTYTLRSPQGHIVKMYSEQFVTILGVLVD